MLNGKKIILGVCGSIAAYKAAFITRLLIKHGAEVKVIMTDSAISFIAPLTLSTLSKNPVISGFVKDDSPDWNNHVHLGQWADVFLVAPASANTIAKMANGICDNMMLATYLSAKCPVIIAPAMDFDMWGHPATQRNIKRLQTHKNQVIDVEEGELASGLFGKGRMAEPETVIKFLHDFFGSKSKKKLSGKKVLITAGPSLEPIDPVRYISNHSTGKMGIALAGAFSEQGAVVTLILGFTSNRPSDPRINVIPVKTAADFFEKTLKDADSYDILVAAAAISDFTPRNKLGSKIKKEDQSQGLNIELEPTKDVLGALGERKRKGQILVGFALETDNELENAERKLKKKNLDFIVLNSLKDEGAGFQHDTNKITIINRNNKKINFELMPKMQVAQNIVNYLIENNV